MGIFNKLFGKKEQNTNSAQQVEPQKKEEQVPSQDILSSIIHIEPDLPKTPIISIPATYEGKQIAYSYPDVKLKPAGVPSDKIDVNEQLTLIEDGDLVRVNQGSTFIGTLPENRLSGMVHDWNKKGEPYLAYIASYDSSGSKIEIRLVFYENVLEKYLSRNKSAKLVKLTGNPDEFASPVVGGKCEVEYDYEEEKYFVSHDASMIGWLPASASKYAEQHDISPEDLDIIIADIEYDIDKDRDIISVYISD
jgi:hypothetical protein